MLARGRRRDVRSCIPTSFFLCYLLTSVLSFTEGAKLVDLKTEEEIGTITSGIPSPTLGKNVAMGYINARTHEGLHKKGSEVGVVVRGKMRKGVVTPMPFVKPNYFRG